MVTALNIANAILYKGFNEGVDLIISDEITKIIISYL